MRNPLRARSAGDRVEASSPGPDALVTRGDGSMVRATLSDGPLAGERMDIALVEGRPPKTIDVPTRDGSACRYCLEELVQSGSSAVYTFVFRV